MLFTIPYLCLISSIIVVVAVVVIVFGYYYAFKVEVIRYDIKDNKVIQNKNLDEKYDNKIVFFSDLHLGRTLKEKDFRKLVDKLDSLDASLYIFGGDLIGNNYSKYYTNEKVKEIFSTISSKHEIIAINGNHDVRNNFDLSNVGLNVLVNKEYIYNNIHIYGMNEGIHNDLVIPSINDENKNLILIHEGDFVDKINGKYTMLSGHTHGGQINIPLLNFCYRPKFGKKYLNGLHTKDNKNLIVSKGLGTNLFKIRLFAKCDIIVIDMKGK